MSRFWQHFITNGGEDSGVPDPAAATAFGRRSARRVLARRRHRRGETPPAVVNLRVGQGMRGGTGSGVLFTPDGFLLTNHHVVQGSEKVRVRLNDGTEMSGRVVGNDPWTDLAVVQAEGETLPVSPRSATPRSSRSGNSPSPSAAHSGSNRP